MTHDAGPPDVTRDEHGCTRHELCGNGLDDDCNARVDDGCGCVPATHQSCFPGAASARDVGACVSGTMTCSPGLEFGEWEACVGAVLPSEERCDAAGLDEDCDGAVNEGCECTVGTTTPCGMTEGACEAGMQRCEDGHLGACEGAVLPSAEVCNGVDDDCDGATDEELVRACGTTRGACIAGSQTCAAGVWGACVGAHEAGVEVCNGIDDDCDGAADEELVRACGTDTGACVAGTETCAMGAWGTCTGAVGATAEVCNGIDDDCDGATDEDLVRACGTDTGACMAGTETCAAGTWRFCNAVGPVVESCNTFDDDCDGSTDEGCACVTGATRPCGTDEGACVAGRETCTAAGAWGACTGATGPVSERCNGVDDDCDGTTDEDACMQPLVACPGSTSTEVGSTLVLNASGSDPDGGDVTYGWRVVTRPSGSSAMPTPSTGPRASFTPDATGTFQIELCTTDDEGARACCTFAIAATMPCRTGRPLELRDITSAIRTGSALTRTEYFSVQADDAWRNAREVYLLGADAAGYDYVGRTFSGYLMVGHTFGTTAASPYTVDLTYVDAAGATRTLRVYFPAFDTLASGLKMIFYVADDGSTYYADPENDGMSYEWTELLSRPAALRCDHLARAAP